ncbi:ribonuclease PH [Marinicauda pacifica]|jgi:ribonuclease PH|uniref:Ribonuclease PH n=1 Tax=Marinicauda pacifica TaxID=1133559 RepID=A0A4S2H9G6_9PROT|nr:ribonuclease PH [Marinicauda pacifica]TGY92456.1 ribonuclease PH [Marinicauda pacifica]GGE49087.1 ribonuclease PH [Marinicauda pacifica]
MRPENRAADALRPVRFELGASPYAEGSCLSIFGNTRVLCTASVDESTPPWLRGKGRGWVTAEYAMLPRATHQRTRREVTAGKPSGRTQEIQRLIGRSLRAVTDLSALGERQILIDCDVLQADGGTRTAAITGAWLALKQATAWLVEEDVLKSDPVFGQLAAVSAGIVDGQARLDLEYEEDRVAEADANFVLTNDGGVVEIQATAEDRPITSEQFADVFSLARKGIGELCLLQSQALG